MLLVLKVYIIGDPDIFKMSKATTNVADLGRSGQIHIIRGTERLPQANNWASESLILGTWQSILMLGQRIEYVVSDSSILQRRWSLILILAPITGVAATCWKGPDMQNCMILAEKEFRQLSKMRQRNLLRFAARATWSSCSGSRFSYLILSLLMNTGLPGRWTGIWNGYKDVEPFESTVNGILTHAQILDCLPFPSNYLAPNSSPISECPILGLLLNLPLHPTALSTIEAFAWQLSYHHCRPPRWLLLMP